MTTPAPLRVVAPADVPAVCDLAVRAGLFGPDDVEVVAEALTGDGERLALLVPGAAGPLGVALAEPARAADRLWYLLMLGVDATARRQGIARRLVEAVEERLRAEGVRLLLVETSALSQYEAARGFYDALGYDEEARVRDFHADGDDMVLFRKDLRHG